MCGRYNLRTPPGELAKVFELDRWADVVPRYNIAPTQSVPAIRVIDGERRLDLLQWGLIPSWADDPKIGNRLINARADTVASKPSFRSAFRKRRCLVPADGFYEWRKTSTKTKQPFHVTLKCGSPFGFAGLWERWAKGAEGPIESFTIITTDANELVADIHDRMPVILPAEHYGVWLDLEIDDSKALESLLVPYSANEMLAVPVSTAVNSPRNDSPECIVPVQVD
ncbi:MAG: SOS response-associated peptidase [Planctomycetaceae bacterium]